MMKYLLFSVAMFLAASTSAQLGTAHDFTVTDLDGNEISLYEDILDQGLLAVIDVSATWCGPCWSLHQSHVLEEFYQTYGPDGSNQVRVVFYEGDSRTSLADLQGTGGNTLGNWIDGVSYPIVNESSISLDLDVYAPLGFPTVNIIRPSDKEIIADIWNVFDLEDFVDAIHVADPGMTLGVTTSTEDVALAETIGIFPNPADDFVTIDVQSLDGTTNISILNIQGQYVFNQQVTGGLLPINTSDFTPGIYTVLIAGEQIRTSSKLVIAE